MEIQDTGASIENIHLDPLLFQQLQSSGMLIQDIDTECPITFGIDPDGNISLPPGNEIINNEADDIAITDRLDTAFIKIMNASKSEPEHECEICNKKYKCKSSLRKHIKVHEAELKCHKCVKRFCRQETLDIHMKMHQKVESLKCDYCDNSFSREGHLKTHMKR